MSSYQIGIIIQICISIMTVVAVFAITGLAGMFSLGQAAYLAIGAYVTFVLHYLFKWPYYITGLISLILCGLVALIIGIPTLKLRKDYFALITVGLGQMVVAVILLLERYTNGSIGFSKIPRAPKLFWVTLFATILIIYCIRNLKYSRFGRMALALKNDEIVAKSFGIDVYQLKLKIYILASIIAGFAGILMAMRNRVITPDSFGWATSAEMQIFLFFGGTNSLTGAVLSAIVLRIIPEFVRNIEIFGTSLQEFRTILYCIVIIFVIGFRPQGVLGERELGFGWLKQRFARLTTKPDAEENDHA
ncbi:MAG TPA: branched-chain amino acid ABC transporter permease [Anaerolineaceae bacterium]|mgnify:CR=1 FL=1|nr:branched-chain amino acid ABC transporter permease [Chloroflexota bacterium]HNY83449.1 branched-chain amino acid ABC transporter permease [Anaerolineaceae bacterium]